jgi:hypothetical protein
MVSAIKKPLNMAHMYRNHLAPRQQCGKLSLHVAPGIHAIVKNLWSNSTLPKKKRLCSFAKLIDKGMVNPKSVRYISPQILRCGQCTKSRAFVVEMLQRWLLGSYPHRYDVIDPKTRQKVLSLDFTGLLHLIRQQPSKHLYCIVAECIAAVSVADPQIHIVAAACNPHFAAYVEAVCSNAAVIASSVLNLLNGSKPRRKRIQLSPVLFNLTTPLKQQTVSTNKQLTFITTSDSVKALQANLTLRTYGTSDVYAFICNSCQIVHGSVLPPTRGSKLKAGVSINLVDPDDISCNMCLQKVVKKSFVGFIAITPTSGNVTVCCKCANICGHINPIGSALYCRACAKVAMKTQASGTCTCGITNNNPNAVEYFTARIGKRYTVYTACAEHMHMIATLKSACTETPSVTDCNLFFSTYSNMI